VDQHDPAKEIALMIQTRLTVPSALADAPWHVRMAPSMDPLLTDARVVAGMVAASLVSDRIGGIELRTDFAEGVIRTTLADAGMEVVGAGRTTPGWDLRVCDRQFNCKTHYMPSDAIHYRISKAMYTGRTPLTRNTYAQEVLAEVAQRHDGTVEVILVACQEDHFPEDSRYFGVRALRYEILTLKASTFTRIATAEALPPRRKHQRSRRFAVNAPDGSRLFEILDDRGDGKIELRSIRKRRSTSTSRGGCGCPPHSRQRPEPHSGGGAPPRGSDKPGQCKRRA
jgi:hypothetical protein